jgi:DNA-binding NtrC family response regulator
VGAGREAIVAERVKQSGTVPTVVLVGLAEGLAEELGKALSREGCTVCFEPLLPRDLALGLIDRADADVVFCPAEPERYAPFLEAIKVERPGVPVVVFSRLPEVSAWLDALERGAVEYCAPRFESAQIHWVLQSALKAAMF